MNYLDYYNRLLMQQAMAGDNQYMTKKHLQNEYQKAYEDLGEDKSNTNPKDLVGARKPALSLFPASAIIHGAKVMEGGRDKYGLFNWRDKKVQSLVYVDAALRHLLKYVDGWDLDEESGLMELAHAMMSIAVIIDATENNNLVDTRPHKGNAAELLKRLTKS